MENEQPQQPGLVISDITGGELPSRRFVSTAELAKVAESIPRREARDLNDRRPRFTLELSPGSVRLTSFWPSPVSAEPRDGAKVKQKIAEWTAKSRAKMVERLCSLDYTALMSDAGRIPALITLTYPGDWETVCPDGETAARHLRLFQKRYRSKFGEPLVGIWKREFQARGACHFHILMCPPVGEGFRSWLSEVWADIVAHPDPHERAKHLRAGTGVDYEQGLRSYDPKRVAVYFSKHSSANGGGAKEYQNRVPDLWTERGSVGRFWGYWGLPVAIEGVPIANEDAVKVARVLRKWARANGTTHRIAVRRVNTRTGEIRRRFVRRRVRRFPKQLGFLSVNDGAVIGEALARVLTEQRPTPLIP